MRTVPGCGCFFAFIFLFPTLWVRFLLRDIHSHELFGALSPGARSFCICPSAGYDACALSSCIIQITVLDRTLQLKERQIVNGWISSLSLCCGYGYRVYVWNARS